MNTTQNIRYLHKKLEDVNKNVYCIKQYIKNNPGGGGGDYELTSAKITTALGYTPMDSTHPASAITSAKISSWDNKLNKIEGSNLNYLLVKPDGSLSRELPSLGTPLKVLSLDNSNTPCTAETVEYKKISSDVVEPTVVELESYNTQQVDFPNLNAIFIRCGNKWLKIVGTDV